MQLNLAPWNWFKPSRLNSFTNLSKIICVIYLLCLSCFRVCSLLPCGHLLGRGWSLGSCLWCLIVFLSLSHVVSWVRCSTWLYRLLIFVAFLTFIVAANDISSPKVTYTYYTFNFCFLFMKSAMGGWLMEDWKAFFTLICGVSFFITAMCIVYVCSVLTSSIITSLENVSYIVS